MRQLTMSGFGVFASSKKPANNAQMYLTYGRTPGRTCGECAYLCRRVNARGGTWYKCELMKITRGAATDIRRKYAACGKFREAK